MRTGRARRLLAVATVTLAVVGSAYAQLMIASPTAATNGSVPASTVAYVVFSVRNISGSAIDITSFAPQGLPFTPAPGCIPVTIGRIDDPSNQAVTLQPNQQQQYIAIASGFTATGIQNCTWDILTNPLMAPGPTVTTSFDVSSSPSIFNQQATAIDFGSQVYPSFETQSALITNYGSSAQTAFLQISNSVGSTITFVGGACTGNETCSLFVGSNAGSAAIGIKCQPMSGSSAAINAMLYAYGSGSGVGSDLLGTSTIYCDAQAGSGAIIMVGPDPLNISAPLGTTGSGSATVSAPLASTTLSSAAVFGDATFSIADCGGPSCSFGTPEPLPRTLTITCVTGSSPKMATLQVTEPGGGSAITNINCVAAGGPVLTVMPSSLNLGSIPVGMEASDTITLDNIGGSDVTNLELDFGVQSANWRASTCAKGNPCTIAPNDPPLVVTITFQPQSHGDKGTSLAITSNTPPASVGLSGVGLGGVMTVTPVDLPFGTITLGQPYTRTIMVGNTGNAPIDFVTSNLSPPYSVDTVSDTVFPNTPKIVTVTCESTTPSTSNEQALTISSNAYQGSPQPVALHCAIANTAVQISPQTFDFGEVRIGSPMQAIDVTVTNPSSAGGSAHITRMELHEPRTGLSLAPPATDTTLAPATSTSASIRLATNVETDLTGEFLDIDVDSAMLALPITGKVVTPHSRVVPETLDLGTACVGTQISGDVMLINDGTATLAVQAPQMDQSFLASSGPGTSYPATLPAGSSLVASVAPAMSASGKIGGTLTWEDDVPSNYAIDVTLNYIATGTALSPAALDFGSVPVDLLASPQHITLENCDLTPTDVTIKAINTRQGTVGAWVIEPRLGYKKTLPAHDKQGISVTFRPPARGRYEAFLEIVTSAGPQSVHLIGDATGRDFEDTSFYACACSGPGAPSKGWPIALAILVIVRRRGSLRSNVTKREHAYVPDPAAPVRFNRPFW